jgi:general secretion pathway protein K
MRRCQRGIALLTAIILVAVAAIVATAIAWQSELSQRRGIAVFTVTQSLALAEGAEAMAGYALKSSRSSASAPVSPSQGWATPYGPVEIDNGAVLEASLEDEAGKFNLNSVVMQGPAANTQIPGTQQLVANPTAVAIFTALLQALNINTDYAARLVDWIDSDSEPTFPGGAEDSYYLAQQPPLRTPNMPLTSVSELLAMGMDRDSYNKLAPLVTALPPNVTLNLCTAPGFVLDAYAGGGQSSYALMSAQDLANRRQQSSCFPDIATFSNGIDPANWAKIQKLVGTTSAYFRLRTWITIGTTRFTLYSLLYQGSGTGQVLPILRTFGTE